MNQPQKEKLPRFGKILLVILGGGLLLAWMIMTPPGLLGKSDAAAYAVCHRISSHSFYFGDRPFSLCARCSGQYLGFLWGFATQVILARKRSGFPSRWKIVGFAVLVLIYALDGFNSLFHLYPGLREWSLYTPSNLLRLFSGLGMGLSISVFYYPLMGQTIWKDWDPGPALSGFRHYAVLFAGGMGMGLLVLSENPLILYPMILLSTGGLLALLTLLYSVIWVLLRRRENSFNSWVDLSWWIVAGFGTGIFQIALIDAIRYLSTGTWSGFLDY